MGAMQARRPLFSGIISSSIIAGAHFVSSVVVVVAYILVVNTLNMQIPEVYMKYGAAVALGKLAYIFWKENGEDLSNTQYGHLHDSLENFRPCIITCLLTCQWNRYCRNHSTVKMLACMLSVWMKMRNYS